MKPKRGYSTGLETGYKIVLLEHILAFLIGHYLIANENMHRNLSQVYFISCYFYTIGR